MMKYTFYCLVFFQYIILSAGCSNNNRQSLFNGENLDGWAVKAVPEDLDKSFWYVNDGYIEANTMGHPDHDYIWLYSGRSYADFEIEFEFQAFRDSPGNSGIQIRSFYDENEHWLNGPQIDIHPPEYWRTGMMWDETRGNQQWIYPEIPQGTWVDSSMALNDHVMYFSDDQPSWNSMRVRAEGMQVQAWLNGVRITDYSGEGVLDDSLHAAKKTGRAGHIAFQIHTGDELRIRFRNIFIREL